MNWQAVKAAPGNYVTLSVVVTKITHKTGQYGAYALGKAQDGPGEVEDVLFTVKRGEVLPPHLAVGHRIIGGGMYDANTGKTKILFNSFCQQQGLPIKPTPIPNSYGVPTTASPAAPMVAPQPVYVPAEKDPTRVSIERQCAWKAACRVAANQQIMLKDVVEWAVRGAKFMGDGLGDPVNPQNTFAPPPEFDPGVPDDSNIPF